jgi:hypothetical protein
VQAAEICVFPVQSVIDFSFAMRQMVSTGRVESVVVSYRRPILQDISGGRRHKTLLEIREV